MITNKSDSHKWLQIKVIVTNDYKFSSNINEVIKAVLNFSFFFYKKISQVQKSTKPLTANKNKKKCVLKTSKKKKLLIRLFAFCVFAWLCFYAFSAFNAFSACKIFL